MILHTIIVKMCSSQHKSIDEFKCFIFLMFFEIVFIYYNDSFKYSKQINAVSSKRIHSSLNKKR